MENHVTVTTNILKLQDIFFKLFPQKKSKQKREQHVTVWVKLLQLTKSFAVGACRARVTVTLSPVGLVIPRRATSLVMAALVTEMTRATSILIGRGRILTSWAVVADVTEPRGFREPV